MRGETVCYRDLHARETDRQVDCDRVAAWRLVRRSSGLGEAGWPTDRPGPVSARSINLSRSGERNAENVLELEDAAIAEQLAGYVDQVRARYPPLTF